MDRHEFDELERNIAAQEKRLEVDRRRLKSAQASCPHKWGETEYVPEYKDAYTIPGDPPGTMGVDRRGPTYVDAKTTKRWTRQCGSCGLTQTTERTSKKYVQGSVAGTGGQVDMPDFGRFR